MSSRRMIRIAVFAAALCVISPFCIPIGPVPVSLATLGVYLVALCLGPSDACIAVAVYLALGAAGLPVFSGFGGGVQRIVGVTGGFLIGYIPCAAISGIGWRSRKRWFSTIMLLLGSAVCYGIGLAWFLYLTDSTLPAALLICVIPFLPGDAVKVCLSVAIAPRLNKALYRDRAHDV